MKSIPEIIAYLEMELADAHDQHEQTKGHDRQAALLHLIRAATIKCILEEIKR